MDKFTSPETLTETLKSLNVTQIILYGTLIFILKIVINWASKYLSNRIRYRYDDHNLNLK